MEVFLFYHQKLLKELMEIVVFGNRAIKGLAVDGELMSFTHKGFWQPMDTLRDKLFLEELLEQGKAPNGRYGIK